MNECMEKKKLFQANEKKDKRKFFSTVNKKNLFKNLNLIKKKFLVVSLATFFFVQKFNFKIIISCDKEGRNFVF